MVADIIMHVVRLIGAALALLWLWYSTLGNEPMYGILVLGRINYLRRY